VVKVHVQVGGSIRETLPVEQVRAVASWAADDDRLGVGFLRSVLHDTPAWL